jgi:hypothetical protein
MKYNEAFTLLKAPYGDFGAHKIQIMWKTLRIDYMRVRLKNIFDFFNYIWHNFETAELDINELHPSPFYEDTFNAWCYFKSLKPDFIYNYFLHIK